jgi:hypothetical protein
MNGLGTMSGTSKGIRQGLWEKGSLKLLFDSQKLEDIEKGRENISNMFTFAYWARDALTMKIDGPSDFQTHIDKLTMSNKQ